MKPCAEQGVIATVRNELDYFLQVTAFKSFQFIKNSAHWTESIFWVVVVIATTVFAIRDVRRACLDFTNEATAISMRVNGLQKMTFDKAIICVDYNPQALTKSHSEFAAKSKMFDIIKGENTSTLKFLQKSLNLFTVISLLEMGRSVDYERKIEALLNSSDDLQDLHNWLREQKAIVTQLWRYVGAWLCQSAEVQITTFARGTSLSTIDPCDPEKITWLGVIPFVSIPSSETTFCVDIGGRISFDGVLDLVVISINNEGLLKGLAAERTGDYILNSYLDLSGDPVSTDMTKDFIEFPTHGCLAIRVGIDAELRLLDRSSARCDAKGSSRLACYGDCDVRRYDELPKPCSNCTLFGWRYLYENERKACFDLRTMDEYAECRRLVPRWNFSDSCFRSCLFPCVLRQIGIDVVNQGCEIYALNRMHGASLELAPKQFTVAVFEEHFAVGMSELFSRIGGTCGLWLGVGMLGVCHALLFPLKVFSKLLQRRLKKQSEATISAMELKSQVDSFDTDTI